MDAPDWPDQDTVLALVRRLPDDPVAHAEFQAAVYLPLVRDLQSLHRADDPAMVLDVVQDLVLAFVKRPHQYDPDRLSVRAYLKMAADGDLRNALAKARRRTAREIPLEFVAEPAADGKEDNGDDVRAWLADPRVAGAIADLNDTERAVWELMLTGDRSTAACATPLGLTHRPVAEQEREVKRVKDRIVKRLKRAQETGR